MKNPPPISFVPKALTDAVRRPAVVADPKPRRPRVKANANSRRVREVLRSA